MNKLQSFILLYFVKKNETIIADRNDQLFIL